MDKAGLTARVVSTVDCGNPVFDFLDGRTVTRKGIQGRFKVQVVTAKYPYPRTLTSLIWEPTAKGRATAAYQKVKRELGDDWTSDLTQDPEEFCAIAIRLGFTL